MDPSEYDGFYFLPGEEDNELCFSFFEFDGKLADSKKVDSNNAIGDVWHIAFFTKDGACLCLMIRLKQFWVIQKCT